MSVYEIMKKDTAYTIEELSSMVGMTISSTEAEVMHLFQEGKLKVKQVGNKNFYAIKE